MPELIKIQHPELIKCQTEAEYCFCVTCGKFRLSHLNPTCAKRRCDYIFSEFNKLEIIGHKCKTPVKQCDMYINKYISMYSKEAH